MKEKLINWLDEIKNDAMPPSNIIAFNFGIFQTKKGFQIYLTGSEHYNNEDDDWAFNEHYVPNKKYFNAEEYSKHMGWSQFLDFAKLNITEAIKHNKNAQDLFANAMAVTTGFDDGDLILLNIK